MADELRLVFIIIGALVLGALLLHGLWTVRKNSGQPRHRYYDEQQPDSTEKADGFDDFGVGQVRVVKKGTAAEKPSAAKSVAKTEPLKRPEPQKAVAEVQTELAFDEPKEPELNFSALSEDELQQPAFEAPAEQDEPAPAAEEPAEVLILYVLLPESKDMKGPDLLSALLTLGFKYGEMDIFHRHLDSAGSGAVLFSLANMFNPGTFDLENIEKLSTRGVSLFMTLPGPGEPLQNFNLMHNAAKKLAEEFGGQVLDGQRSVLTVQTVRHYVDKIREFQRQRLIHG
ncbi:cell division protein ZipA [Rheinheimera sp.]|uniref:cell division protein ZipA n=1 Tax=Rheinheimera sp. TaxID=1869214 RepID=UPI0027355979|nr:cell division protein ZipA [Rheinheimera sp.]MDP2713823.1 cell division protein ZipA [Rheinheimera sp.]